MVWFQIVARKMPEIMSAAPASARNASTSPNDGIRPASPIPAPYDGGRHDDRPAVVVHAGGPAAQRGGHQGTDGLGGVEQPDELGSLEHVLGERGEHHHREREHHGGDVDEVGAEDVAPARGVPHALRDAPQAGRGRLGAVRVRPHQHVEHGGHRQPADVDDEAPADPDEGEQHPAERRAEEQAHLHPEAAERVRRGQLVVGDGARQQRLAGGPLQRGGAGEQRGDDEDHRDARLVAEGVPRQHRGEAALGDARADEQPAPVDVVGQGAAVQPEHHQRHELDDADRADREVGAGERVDLVGHRDVRHHRAEVEDRAGHEQQPEVARGAQRRHVEAQPAQPLGPGHGHRWWHRE